MSVAVVNGLKFHYWKVGDGPNIVMLHGLGGNLALWHLRAVPMLRDRYTVTSYDLRGHGHSEMSQSGYTTADMAADLHGLMDAIGIEKAHLVGHSLGADIALHFAMHYPERAEKLILVEAGLPALVAARKREDWIGWTYWGQVVEKATGHPIPPDKRTDYRYLLHCTLEATVLFGPRKGQPRKQEKFLKLFETTTLVDDYEVVGDLTLENIAKIDHPKLLIYDTNSPYIETYHELCQRAKNYKSVLLPPSELRHFFPLEQPEVLVHHIESFIETGEPYQEAVMEAQHP